MTREEFPSTKTDGMSNGYVGVTAVQMHSMAGAKPRERSFPALVDHVKAAVQLSLHQVGLGGRRQRGRAAIRSRMVPPKFNTRALFIGINYTGTPYELHGKNQSATPKRPCSVLLAYVSLSSSACVVPLS